MGRPVSRRCCPGSNVPYTPPPQAIPSSFTPHPHPGASSYQSHVITTIADTQTPPAPPPAPSRPHKKGPETSQCLHRSSQKGTAAAALTLVDAGYDSTRGGPGRAQLEAMSPAVGLTRRDGSAEWREKREKQCDSVCDCVALCRRRIERRPLSTLEVGGPANRRPNDVGFSLISTFICSPNWVFPGVRGVLGASWATVNTCRGQTARPGQADSCLCSIMSPAEREDPLASLKLPQRSWAEAAMQLCRHAPWRRGGQSVTSRPATRSQYNIANN